MSGNKERITISVDAAVKSELESQVPKNRRSAFAEKALKDALERLASEKALAALDTQLLSNWQIVEPSRAQWKNAQNMSEKGSVGSGYPTMYDSIYHALAIAGYGDFITAGKKHCAKAQSFDHICLLENWKGLPVLSGALL